jgi:rhodanese-related sulfurtransferase
VRVKYPLVPPHSYLSPGGERSIRLGKMRKTSFIFYLIAAFSLVLAGCSGTTTEAARKDISVADAHALIETSQSNPTFVILDVRTPAEYAAGHIEGAINIDYQAADFRDRVSKLEKVKSYLVYCRTGVRSAAASDIMVDLGFYYVSNMTGGITDWQAAGFPVVK